MGRHYVDPGTHLPGPLPESSGPSIYTLGTPNRPIHRRQVIGSFMSTTSFVYLLCARPVQGNGDSGEKDRHTKNQEGDRWVKQEWGVKSWSGTSEFLPDLEHWASCSSHPFVRVSTQGLQSTLSSATASVTTCMKKMYLGTILRSWLKALLC